MSAPDYDHSDVWEKEIKPLTDKLVEICGKHGMPLLVCTVSKCDEDHAEFVMGFIPGRDKWVPEEMVMAATILRLSDERILGEVIKRLKRHTDVSRN